MDIRIKKTQQAVFRSFAELLYTKPYSQITIQDILDHSKVGRSTFYAHFHTKEDLLRSICSDILLPSSDSEINTQKRVPKAVPAVIPEFNKLIRNILYHIQTKNYELKAIVGNECKPLFLSYFDEQLSTILEPLTDYFPYKIPKEFLLSYLVNSLSGCIIWWMHHTQYSCEDICVFFLSLNSEWN